MKRTKKINIRVSHTEHAIIKNKAYKSSCSISEYMRNVSMGNKLSYRLTSDEINVYNQLSKYSSNFINITNYIKKGDITGLKEETFKTAKLIQEHLKKLQ